MNDTQINSRQQMILTFLFNKPASTRSEIEKALDDKKVSRITIIRDLNHLIELDCVDQLGGGKYITYSLKKGRELLIPIDVDEYYQTKSDNRDIKHKKYNPIIIDNLSGLLTSKERVIFEQGKNKLRNKFKNLDPSLLKRELERFTIELSWKSSQIEGNTYSLLETEELGLHPQIDTVS